MQRRRAGRPGPLWMLALLLIVPTPLWAAGSDGELPHLLLTVAAMLVAGKLLGEGAERLGLPSVLGELVAGVLLGASVLGVVPAAGEPSAEMLRVLAELGVILLLFEVGLETDLREMSKVGGAALAVACVGVVVPFALGYLYWAWLRTRSPVTVGTSGPSRSSSGPRSRPPRWASPRGCWATWAGWTPRRRGSSSARR
ncbi:MAG: cation:proton antiporter [Gemmatimonadetes bacterium]|nr:cation:proton antiporter [Gemmatimonadota bacterium]